uniref:Lon N-terminal domain-containing protein n=1 Tax=Fagus sylvatica TaxID=28930 RepID=A0A2N9EQ56_FAGSY
MEGNHRMGMVIIDSTTGSIADFACEVEITECEPLPDGRFYLEIESRRRFRIVQSWDQDGYRVAEVEWVKDIYPPEGSRERAELQELANNAAEYAQSWVRKAREAAQQVDGTIFTADSRRLEKFLNVEAMMPTPQDPEHFSFWLATLSNRRPHEKLDLLRIRDTREIQASGPIDPEQIGVDLVAFAVDFNPDVDPTISEFGCEESISGKRSELISELSSPLQKSLQIFSAYGSPLSVSHHREVTTTGLFFVLLNFFDLKFLRKQKMYTG